MRKSFIFPAFISISMAVSTLSACDSASKGSDTIKEKDLPYGSTLVVANNFSIPIQYDRRFMTQKLLAKVTDYYKSVEDTDVSRYQGVVYPFYHNYMMETAYEGKSNDSELLQTEYDNFKDAFGADFDFSFIDITGLDTDRTISDCASLLSGLDNIAAQKGEDKISDQVKDICHMTITVHMTEDDSGVRNETGKMIEDLSMFALNIKDTWYLIED